MQHHNYSAISKLTDEIKNLNIIFKRLESDVEAGEKWTMPLWNWKLPLNVNAGETPNAHDGSV